MRILIVDDDPSTRTVIRRVLVSELACETVEASQGLEAIEKIATSGPFDLVILDLQMPKVDGIATLRAIRASGHSDLPVVILTAEANEKAVVQTATLGITAYLTKPINPFKLAARLGEIVGQIENPGATPREPGMSRSASAHLLLIVDPDKGFRDRVKAAIAGRLAVIEVDNGLQALQALTPVSDADVPQVAVIGPSTGLLSGQRLVERIRQVVVKHRVRLVGAYPEADAAAVRDRGTYDDVIVRESDDDAMTAALDRVLS